MRDQCKGRRRQQGCHHGCNPFLAIDLLGRLLLVPQARHLLEPDARVNSTCPLCQWWRPFRLLEQHSQLPEGNAIQECKPAGRGAQRQGRTVGEDFAKDAIEFLFEDGGEHNVNGGACHEGEQEATQGGSRCGGEVVRVRREDWEGSIGFCTGVVPVEVSVSNRFCLVVGDEIVVEEKWSGYKKKLIAMVSALLDPQSSFLAHILWRIVLLEPFCVFVRVHEALLEQGWWHRSFLCALVAGGLVLGSFRRAVKAEEAVARR